MLRVDGLGAPALPLAGDPAAGTGGAILGFPLNGPFDAQAARIGATRTVLSQDAYGRGPVRVAAEPLRGRVRSGNSGGPLVDARGRVLTTVFAATTSGAPAASACPNAVVGARRSRQRRRRAAARVDRPGAHAPRLDAGRYAPRP